MHAVVLLRIAEFQLLPNSSGTLEYPVSGFKCKTCNKISRSSVPSFLQNNKFTLSITVKSMRIAITFISRATPSTNTGVT